MMWIKNINAVKNSQPIWTKKWVRVKNIEPES